MIKEISATIDMANITFLSYFLMTPDKDPHLILAWYAYKSTKGID
jgi:hypothetical protein